MDEMGKKEKTFQMPRTWIGEDGMMPSYGLLPPSVLVWPLEPPEHSLSWKDDSFQYFVISSFVFIFFLHLIPYNILLN